MKVIESKVTRRYKAGYEIRLDTWEFEGGDTVTIKCAYTTDGHYIGDSISAYRLCYKRGIKPELISPEHSVCSIGFSEKEQKWYGWSHRAIYGFGVGSSVKKGDIAYIPSTPQELYDELTTPDDSGWSWKDKDDVEITKTGVRVRERQVKLKKEYENIENNCTCNKDCAHDSGIYPPYMWEETDLTYFEIECGKGEWTAESLEDAKQMAINFANRVS